MAGNSGGVGAAGGASGAGGTMAPRGGTGAGGMSGGGAGGMSGGGAGMAGGGAGAGPVDCSMRGGEPTGSCKDSASGTFAIKTEVDVWWAQDTATPIVDPGRGKITVYLMGKLSGVCEDGVGKGVIRGCGTVLPPFVSYAACDAFQIEFPDALWDQPTMPTFETTGNTSGFEPGETLAINIATGLIGIDMNDPDMGTWPTPDQTGTFACPLGMGQMCFPDDDGDMNPGVTLKMGKIGQQFKPNGCGLTGDDPVVYRGVPFDAIGGVDDASVRAETLYVGIRTRIGGAGLIGSDCKSGVGDAMAVYMDSRVFDCIATDGSPCELEQSTFIDENAPNYNILAKGAAPPTDKMRSSCECPDGCLGAGCPLDQTPSAGPRSAIVRLGGLDENFDCAAVRNAPYPAL
jgi:hypothetical protein